MQFIELFIMLVLFSISSSILDIMIIIITTETGRLDSKTLFYLDVNVLVNMRVELTTVN